MEINWDITCKCDLRCAHCGALDLINSNDSITLKEYLNVAENIANVAETVTLVGGEPMLAEHLIEVLLIFKRTKTNINIITNGQSHLSKYKELLMYNIENITVSMDGTKDENDIIRGEGTWDKAYRCLCFLINEKRKGNLKNIGLNIVINKINKDSIINLLNLIDTRRLNSVQISNVSYIGNAQINKDKLYMTEKELIEIYLEIARYAEVNNLSNIIHLNTGNCFVDELLYLSVRYKNVFDKKCGALFESGYVDKNGIFYPCRTYKGNGFDFKTVNVDYEELLNHFNEFILMQDELEYMDKNSECLHYDNCNYCPLNIVKCNNLCEKSEKTIFQLILSRNWINISNSFFIDVKNRYYGYYLTKQEKVEYTYEGYIIHKVLKNISNVDNVFKETKLPKKTIAQFLLNELKEERVKCCN